MQDLHHLQDRARLLSLDGERQESSLRGMLRSARAELSFRQRHADGAQRRFERSGSSDHFQFAQSAREHLDAQRQHLDDLSELAQRLGLGALLSES